MKRSLPMLPAATVSATICEPCGGKCCKSYPGINAPEDFGAPNRDEMRTRIRAALLSGRWAIDWWEGDPRGYDHGDDDDYLSSSEFIRPAQKGHENEIEHAGWGGACTFLTATGCELAHDDRPRNCRGLIPTLGPMTCQERREDGSPVEKVDYVLAWIPYLDVIADVRRELRHAA